MEPPGSRPGESNPRPIRVFDAVSFVHWRPRKYCGPTRYVIERPLRVAVIRADLRAFVSGKWRLSLGPGERAAINQPGPARLPGSDGPAPSIKATGALEGHHTKTKV